MMAFLPITISLLDPKERTCLLFIVGSGSPPFFLKICSFESVCCCHVLSPSDSLSFHDAFSCWLTTTLPKISLSYVCNGLPVHVDDLPNTLTVSYLKSFLCYSWHTHPTSIAHSLGHWLALPSPVAGPHFFTVGLHIPYLAIPFSNSVQPSFNSSRSLIFWSHISVTFFP
jgi:hypothetical protein